jgi:glycerophosphoryl diester phosphodiesterase
VPTLSEALEVARGRVRTNVEIKHAAALDGALATMRDLRVEDACVLSSFDHDAIFEAADRDSRVERALIMGEDAPTVWQTLREVWPFWALQRAGARYWHTHGRNAAEPVVRALLTQGIETQVWTVNDAERGAELVARGVAGLFTDRPEAMRAALSARTNSGGA